MPDEVIASEHPELDEDAQSDVDSEALDLSTGERRLVTQPYDLGVKGIVDDIAQGNIALDIQYQRKYVWDRSKASRLIESLLLNIPIPVCYFAEDENGVYEVIDGLQRLTTIRDFLLDDFALSGLPVLSELEGKKFSELAPRDRRRLENRTIRCIVITEDSHPDIKFDVFERLNTGAATLTAQELRNSVYRGPFNDSLRELAQAEYFTDLVGTANKRMDLEEVVLRFLALVSDLDEYKPPLRQFLNEYMRGHRQEPINQEDAQRFADCCVVAGKILGDSPFRVPGSKNLLNKALFDAVMVPIAHSDHGALEAAGASAVRAVLEALLQDEQFQTAIGRATADRQRMIYRVGAFAHGLRRLDVHVDLPDAFDDPSDDFDFS